MNNYITSIVIVIIVIIAAWVLIKYVLEIKKSTAEIKAEIEKKKIFPLNHVALYAKHWYKRTDNFWADLQKCIGADGYLDNLNPNDVYGIIISRLNEMKIREMDMTILLDGINPKEGWKVGYPTKGNYFLLKPDPKKAEEFPEWDFKEAVVRYCLSVISRMKNEFFEGIVPNFRDVLPTSLHEFEEEEAAFERARSIFGNVII